MLKTLKKRRDPRLLVSRANEIAFTPEGFLDHRGNRLHFGLRVYDDEGQASKVRQLYAAMIEDRLVDILLGPQTQALSEAARDVAWNLQRTRGSDASGLFEVMYRV